MRYTCALKMISLTGHWHAMRARVIFWAKLAWTVTPQNLIYYCAILLAARKSTAKFTGFQYHKSFENLRQVLICEHLTWKFWTCRFEGRGTGSQISHLPNFFGQFSLLPNFFARFSFLPNFPAHFSLLPNFSPSSQISALISWDITLQYLDLK